MENTARTNVETNASSIRDRMIAASNTRGSIPSMGADAVSKELKELRQDVNIVAQHIVAIRNEMKDKMQVMSDTSDTFELATKNVLEKVIQKISDGELDTFSEALGQIIKEDDETNRKKLFEDIERAIIAQTPKAKSSSISPMQWLINLLLIGGIAAVYVLLSGKFI